MKNLFLDFESYYDLQFSLTKITTPEYVLGAQWETLGCSFCWDAGDAWWVDGPDVGKHLATYDWSNIRAIAHNSLFDMLVLSLRYQIWPAAYGDTMSMARNWISHTTKQGRVNLKVCSERYGLPAKGDTIERMKGVNYRMLRADPTLYAEEVAYGKQDVLNCRSLWQKMLEEGFPPAELDVIDWVVKMAAVPQFELDQNILAEHLSEVAAHKAQLLAQAGMDNPDNLMSDTKLSALLIINGVQPPMKWSSKQKKDVYAFAKTDAAFKDLLDHENPTVQALVAARLGHKSTLEETRSKRLLDMSRYVDLAPVPLKYSGAHTHRFSGDWKINLQNLANESKLRKAFRAPPGKLVVSIDASQIEARINAEVSGEQWLIDAFRQGRDVYAEFAQDVFGHPINKKDHPNERFVGKTGILSLGYGSSALVFMNMIRNKSTSGFQINESFAIMTVNMYRSKCARIVEHWRVADRQIIPQIAQGVPVTWGALEISLHTITLPNGNKLHYDNLRHAYSPGDDRFGWLYDREPRKDIKLYGAKVVENECQSLAFVHISEVAMRVLKMTEGLLWPAHQVHDELIYVVDEKLAEQVGALVAAEMSKSPTWMPTIPLGAEVHIGETYGDT